MSGVWPVSVSGRSLILESPLAFLCAYVEAEHVFVQTASWNGTVLFSQYIVAPDVLDDLGVVAEACGWILDPLEAAEAERVSVERLVEIERERVLHSYVAQPLRRGLDRFGVVRDELYVDLPAPVSRAYLGFGVTVSDVERARILDRGIVCLLGHWVGDELELRECYLEDAVTPDVIDAVSKGLSAPAPVPDP